MEKSLLGEKLVQREAPITDEEAMRVEGLVYEADCRDKILAFIKDARLDDGSLSKTYQRERVGFLLELEKTVADYAAKYMKPGTRYSACRADYKEKRLIWSEWVQNETTD